MIEISRTQDEEVGDGTTSVIILGKWPGSGSISSHSIDMELPEIQSTSST
jgi:hypothetical protein